MTERTAEQPLPNEDTSPPVKVAVRDLVEFVLQHGDLQTSFVGAGRALAGTRGHQRIQKSRPPGYEAELSVSYVYRAPPGAPPAAHVSADLALEIGGRIDGVWREADPVTIEEIKTTTLPLESITIEGQPLHWGQAKVYAYLFALQNGLERIGVQVTYLQLDSLEVREFRRTFAQDELEAFFLDLVGRYLEWARTVREWQHTRDAAIARLAFPFARYREGQRGFAVGVYRAIAEGRCLFAQAPTGIGKTVAAVFPALKALGEGKVAKIFYLTAKTVGRGVAEETLAGLASGGLRCKVLTLTAKEKICFLPQPDCQPEACEFARGHFDRVRPALQAIFTRDRLDRPAIEEVAREFRVCPFEFSLFLSLWADLIICDFNYAFDPRVYLRRFFDPPGDAYAFLVDEAHNLPDRAREMFSAALEKSVFTELRKVVKAAYPAVGRALSKITPFFTRAAREIGPAGDPVNRSAGSALKPRCPPMQAALPAGSTDTLPTGLPAGEAPPMPSPHASRREGSTALVSEELPEDLLAVLRRFLKSAEAALQEEEPSSAREALLEVFFLVTAFVRVAETFDRNFVCYWERLGREVRVKLFCLDPAALLREARQRARSTVFFSATLLPMSYFVRILGGGPEDRVLRLTSPFVAERLGLMVLPWVRTEFRVRERSFEAVAEILHVAIAGRRGNYLIYFPSYRYLTAVREVFAARHPEYRIIEQQPGMTEEARSSFLGAFSADNPDTLVGFVVMGGIFGEGIDLRGERLVGSLVVGVGIPQICLERDLIRGFFQEQAGSGFEFAYRFPGMNRVLQAAGRVIRTEEDRGVVLLIDERFWQASYRRLFPREWSHARTVESVAVLRRALQEFWARFP